MSKITRKCEHPGYYLVGWPEKTEFRCVLCGKLARGKAPVGKIENIPSIIPELCKHWHLMFTASQTVLCLNCGARFKPILSSEELQEWMNKVNEQLND